MAESQPVKSFVAGALARGMSRGELRALLLKGGWPKQLVDGYLDKAVRQEPTVRSVILQCKGVRKKEGGRTVIENVELEIGKGEIFGIVGAGGSGKTTLMHMMAGLIVPDAGDVVINTGGAPRSIARDPDVRKLTGFSPQTPSLYDDMTAMENLVQFGTLYGLAPKSCTSVARSLLERVGLADLGAQRSQDLSIGQRKRLDIACALIHRPAILLLDDPAAELDVKQQHGLWNLLRGIAGEGTTVVIASNFLADLESLCDRIAILRNKRVTEVGKPEELRVIYSHNFEIRLRLESEQYAALINALSADTVAAAKRIVKEGRYLIVQTPNPIATLR
ncbi:MAG: ABC transporter ATP-binding protein, partial [Nanoarchaeota archaeon]